MQYSLYEFAAYFIIYAFFGWCLEVAFAAFVKGEFVNRGFLNGPICPIYGFGMVIILAALMPLKENIFILFAASALLTSLLEYITGFVLEKVFHEKWWDYSDMPFNLGGYICLSFSLLWGLACVFVIRLIHPMISEMVELMPQMAGTGIMTIIFAVLAVDIVLTVSVILKIKRHAERIDELEIGLKRLSGGIGEKISDGVIKVMKKKPEIDETLEELARLYRNISEQRIGHRILKAYPNLSKIKRREKLDKIKNTLAAIRKKLDKTDEH